MAKELSRQFLKLGIIMTLVNGDSEINMLARAITADDLLIIISLTGESESVIRIAKVAKTVGSKTISITRINANNYFCRPMNQFISFLVIFLSFSKQHILHQQCFLH
ncbi:MAG: SIS domain-containing protein [Thomasclavelia ramosa]